MSGGSYARMVCAFTITGSGTSQAANTSAITFPTATADWGIVGWVGIYDALSGGNLAAYQNLQKYKAFDYYQPRPYCPFIDFQESHTIYWSSYSSFKDLAPTQPTSQSIYHF